MPAAARRLAGRRLAGRAPRPGAAWSVLLAARRRAPHPSAALPSLLVVAVLLLAAAPRAQTIPDFSATPTTGVQALTVQFTNLTTSDSPALIWSWDFGDGSPPSAFGSPVHVYTDPGRYTVTLSVLPVFSPWVHETKLDFVVVSPGTLDVAFTAAPTAGVAPLTVAFDAQASGTASVADWHWDFGDGATSDEQSPEHTYVTAGAHTVTVTASAGQLAASETQVDLVQVQAPDLSPSFSVDPALVMAATPVQFTDTSSGVAPSSWSWDFGDGATSTQQHPTHAYQLAGSYDVSLTTTFLGFSETDTVPGAVTVQEPDLQPAFTSTPEGAYAPSLIEFEDASTGTPPAEWLWDFGDGDSATGPTAENFYSQPGVYMVELTTRLGGYSASVVQPVELLDPGLEPSADIFPRGGLVPLSVTFTDTSTGGVPFTTELDSGDEATPLADGVPFAGQLVHEYTDTGWFSPRVIATTVPAYFDEALTYDNAVQPVDPEVVRFTTFSEPAPHYLGMPVSEVLAGDLDGDGLPDLIVFSGGERFVFLQADGGFAPPAQPLVGTPLAVARLADMTSDGVLDLVFVSPYGAAMWIWAGDGAGGFELLSSPAVLDDRAEWWLLLDADEDGLTDLVWGERAESALDDPLLRIAYGDGAGGFASVTPPLFGLEFHSWGEPQAGDVDGDGHLDLVGPDYGTPLPYGARYALGDGLAFEQPVFVPGLQGGAGASRVGDVNGDGLADFVLAQDISGQRRAAYSVSAGSATGLRPFVSAGEGQDVFGFQLHDLDGDGDGDLVSGNHVARADGAGGFDLWTANRWYAPGGEWTDDVVVDDFDADGDLDVLRLYANFYFEQKFVTIHSNLGAIGRWADIGGAMTGAAGELQLTGEGELRFGTPVTFTLTGAEPFAPVWFVIGLSQVLLPFKGGVLVPGVDAAIGGFSTDGTGGFTLATTWPGNVPATTPSWYQVWVAESGGLVGSNGLLAVAAE